MYASMSLCTLEWITLITLIFFHVFFLLQVVVPLYYAAFRFNTPKLLACCQHYMLANYDKVEDPGYEALLHLLENSKAASS